MKQMELNSILFNLFVISVSLGMTIYLFDYKFIFVTLLFLLLFSSEKKIIFKEYLFFFPFLLFISIKKLQIQDYQSYTPFFSVEKYVESIMFVFLAFFLLSFVNVCVCNFRKIFFSCFFFSIICSCFVLLKFGTNLYRSGLSKTAGIFLANQNFLFLSMIVAMLLLYEILNNKENQLFKCVGVLICGVYVALASYTTQLLFFLFGLSEIFFIYFLKNKITLTLCFLLLFIVFFVGSEMFSLIPFFAENLFKDNPSIYQRLYEIYYYTQYGDKYSTDLRSRFYLISNSIETFKNNVLFGVNFNEYNNLYKSTRVSVGSHSQWTDDLARLGLVGFSFWLLFLKNGLDFLLPKRKITRFQLSVIVLYLLYGFFNPFISFYFVCCLFLIFRMELKDYE